MTEPQKADSSDGGEQPGKTRTWRHPLLARLLDFSLSSAFTVVDEVLVGKMPLRVDILLLRREDGHLTDSARRDLSALVPLLNRFTLIEFKGPTDVLERGDFARLTGCAYLWHGQQSEPIPSNQVTLIVLAPTISGPLEEELRLLSCEASPHDVGIFSVTGLPFATWLLETDLLAERNQPVLSLVSRVFLNNRGRIIEELKRTGHWALLRYMLQQVQQFHSLGEGFAVQHGLNDNLAEVEEELLTKVLEAVPAERRLRGLSLEDRLAGLSEEEAARLRELLEQKAAASPRPRDK